MYKNITSFLMNLVLSLFFIVMVSIITIRLLSIAKSTAALNEAALWLDLLALIIVILTSANVIKLITSTKQFEELPRDSVFDVFYQNLSLAQRFTGSIVVVTHTIVLNVFFYIGPMTETSDLVIALISILTFSLGMVTETILMELKDKMQKYKLEKLNLDKPLKLLNDKTIFALIFASIVIISVIYAIFKILYMMFN